LKPEVYSYTLRVAASAIDSRNHVNNLKYLEWCLRAAEEHWLARATPAMLAQYVWYVVHHSIDYRAAAFEGEELKVSTWVASSKGVRSERHYQIERLADSKLLVEARTIWCLLDAKNLKPAIISDEIRNLF